MLQQYNLSTLKIISPCFRHFILLFRKGKMSMICANMSFGLPIMKGVVLGECQSKNRWNLHIDRGNFFLV